MIESGLAKNESDLARKVGISRVRIWQYTSLLELNASLVQAVEALGDPMPKRLITERQLRQMLKNPKEQENFTSRLQLSRNP
jgi:biotin operon repressor